MLFKNISFNTTTTVKLNQGADISNKKSGFNIEPGSEYFLSILKLHRC
jgi:hypothetical protein